ncbi:isoleucine--tRNA ligase [Kaistella flava (ex Peng et al. 2021)]|uniref:Isoleucine--tRNA ligase n=1 Tax=Kaistella flava (ex Peng et al. 2021) TaxID=2038776 RepID=A0A7M2YAM5_9FLAO|nr:isoleucine--tRNA ligase [Kaistella flava (ex Peng et al. 2021)]QOW11328.1 isoleucine--tRNA ligase [Kaistella flava (ex Peng et al. 2021)]
MKKFTEYKNLDLTAVAENITQFWEKNQTFKKSVDIREGQPEYVFYEGPPSANGMPGIHHVMARALKDIFCRYQTQNGKQVFRKAGWDTHGLPIELGVEKELGITKEDIGKTISVEDYNQACRNAVMRYTDVWNDLTEKIGYWVDLEDPYITYEPKYMETVWWLLKQLYNKDLMYKGYTIQPYSPAAGTGLSSHELNQPGTYRDVSDTTVVAQFKLKRAPENASETWKKLSAIAYPESNIDTSEIAGASCGGALHWEEFEAEKPKANVYFLAWTTTPWTLPSNTALAVGRDIEYVLVKTFNQYTFEPIHIILASVLVQKNFGKKYFEGTDEDFKNYSSENKTIPYQVLMEFTGEKLAGTEYKQLIPWFLPAENADKAFRVIIGDFVTTEDGTGIVHIAPTFGADDSRVAKENDIPPMLIKDENDNLVPLVDLQGRFLKGGNTPELFAEKFIKNEYYDNGTAPEKSWDVELAILLKTENKAFKVEKYVHSYPHCWRTDKPVLYYPLDSWFVKMTAVKDRLVELNETINWKPKSTGEGRFANWLVNVNDWNLSRSRYWGIPLPIWRTEDLKEEIIIGSVEELMTEIQKSMEAGFMSENPFAAFEVGNMSKENYANIDLHKNIVDEIILVSASGKPMNRESDLIDVWFDSGSMPYAQLHYPFENKEMIDSNKAFPADFIAEGVDQTRGWFYTLHAIATSVFDSVAYKNVMSNGLVLDKNGQKMSKRLGNAVDPFTTLEKYGPDATRWYMISNANPWENLKFDLEGIDEVRRKFFGTLYNTYSFFALYANVDGFTYAEKDVENRPEIDRWILSELNLLVKEVTSFYEDYEPTKVARAINNFVNDNLSNWYVRLCRRRFWKGDYSEDKISAYQTLYTCLETVAKIAAPIAPFFMDQLYQDLNKITGKNEAESIHLTDFPKANESLIDQDLVEKTHLAQQITSMVFSLRKKENIKVRQPLQKVMIPVLDKKTEAQILAVSELVKQEVNVKELQLINADEAAHLIVKQIKPNFKTLGARLGKDMKTVAGEITNFKADQISTLEKEGKMEIQGYEISLDDVEIFTKDIPGWTVTSEGKLTVALDLTLTDELKAEGISREFINRVQNLRKEKELDLTDRITIRLEKNSPFEKEIINNKAYISAEVLSDRIEIVNSLSNFDEIEIDELKFKVEVQKL